MKPKSAHGTRGRPPKHKAFKKEMEIPEDHQETAHKNAREPKPSVEIVSCISYQKFRYSGENRPGKKYQEKDFMELKLTSLGEKVVRVVIICTDAENKELIHPNGLVGKDCHDGIYDKEYAITQQSFNIKIPYLRTERIKTKKNEHEKIRDILKARASHLPSPYRERCESQCTDQYTFNRKFDTTKVCLGVIVTVKSHFQGAVNGSLHAISNVVNNASEKTSLGILKLSNFQFPVNRGGDIDIFTTEEGPAIEYDKYNIYVTYENEEGVYWESSKFAPKKEDILYKRIISYTVPPLDRNLNVKETVEATLHVDCPQSNQSCGHPILYFSPNEDFVFYETQNLKRSYSEELSDVKPPKKLKPTAVKAALQESIKKRGKNSSAPSMQIIQTSHDEALVKRTEPQSPAEDMDQYASHKYISEEQNDQDLKIVTSGFCDSVPSNTVVIFSDSVGTEDIQNVLQRASVREGQEVIIVDSSHPLAVDSSPRENHQYIIVPESRSPDLKNKAKEVSNDTPSHTRVQVHQKQAENNSQTPIASKKKHKTESPWSVGYEEEEENIFSEFSFDKQPVVVEKSQDHYQERQSQFSFLPSSISGSSKTVAGEQQKTITILSNKGEPTAKIVNKETEGFIIPTIQGENPKLDFSEISLPSDINLNSENISKYDIVKEFK